MTPKTLSLFLAGGAGAAALAVSASAETLSYPADGFEAIDVMTGLSVVYEGGPEHSVTAEFEKGGPEDVIVDVVNDTLVIKRKRSGWQWGGQNVRAVFTVTSPTLNSVEVSSGSTFKGTAIDAGDFTIDASSGASASFAGRCDGLEVDISSGASVSASDLICKDGTIDASSGASVSVHLDRTATVDASSGSSIRVSGGPDVLDQDTSSGASVRIEPGSL